MRRAAGVILVLLGTIQLAILGIVVLRLPIPGGLLVHLGDIVLSVDPTIAASWAGAFLLIGILLLRRRSKPIMPTSQLVGDSAWLHPPQGVKLLDEIRAATELYPLSVVNSYRVRNRQHRSI